MTEQTFVKIVIEADEQSNQEGVNLKIELEEDTQVEQLLDYLAEQNKLRIPKDQLVVESNNQQINQNANIGDYAQMKKVDLTIRRKPEKSPMLITSIDIPPTGQVPITPYIQSPVSNPPPRPEPVVPNPPPNKQVQENKKTLILMIAVEDGEIKIRFQFPVLPESTFDDIRKELNQYIMDKNLLDNWTHEEEIKVQKGGNIFKKTSHPFAKLGVPNRAQFTIIRSYPGGGI